MMKHIFLISLALYVCSSTFAQVPMATQVQILKAEDARRYDKTLADLMNSPNLAVPHSCRTCCWADRGRKVNRGVGVFA
jgi:hypothetical protein